MAKSPADEIKEKSKELREGDDEHRISKVLGLRRHAILEEVPDWVRYLQSVHLLGSAKMKNSAYGVVTDKDRKVVHPGDLGLVDIVVMPSTKRLDGWWDWSVEFSNGSVRMTPELLQKIQPRLREILRDDASQLEKVLHRPGDFSDDAIIHAAYYLIEKAEEEDDVRLATRAQSFASIVSSRHRKRPGDRYDKGQMLTMEIKKEIDRTFRKLGFPELTSNGE